MAEVVSSIVPYIHLKKSIRLKYCFSIGNLIPLHATYKSLRPANKTKNNTTLEFVSDQFKYKGMAGGVSFFTLNCT
jgi:hypothetical protein